MTIIVILIICKGTESPSKSELELDVSSKCGHNGVI
jgi:hypothetical protein